jgi:hypothetical protein
MPMDMPKTDRGHTENRWGRESVLHPFVYLASRSAPWRSFAVNIPVPDSFAYPVI